MNNDKVNECNILLYKCMNNNELLNIAMQYPHVLFLDTAHQTVEWPLTA